MSCKTFNSLRSFFPAATVDIGKNWPDMRSMVLLAALNGLKYLNIKGKVLPMFSFV